MNKVKDLITKYPKIFQDSSKSMQETCMCWGIECADGWYTLLDTLCCQLQWDTDRNEYPQVIADQVKEKFGTLRFYYHFDKYKKDKYSERRCGNQEGKIEYAEFLSGFICELCGSTDRVSQTEGWIKTLCKSCMEKSA